MDMMKSEIIAVDFDGTLCENNWPKIGEANKDVIAYLKNRQANGDKLILWTCRVDDMLKNAVDWSAEHGLIFEAVNENLPEVVAFFGSDTRKIFANEYLDDRNILMNSCREGENKPTLYNEDKYYIGVDQSLIVEDKKDDIPNKATNEKKYFFSGEKRSVLYKGGYITLHQIVALRNFGNVVKGDVGGWIESEKNLSHAGNAWVYRNAKVFGNARVYGNAKVSGNAEVYGNARVYGDAEVFDEARVYGDAEVYDKAKVNAYAKVFGNAWVYGNAEVFGNAEVYGNTKVSGNYRGLITISDGYRTL